MASELSDDELLNVPLGNLLPGELARAFAVEAKHAEKVQDEEREYLVSAVERRLHEETEEEREKADIEQREAHLLTQIHEREEELRVEFARQDERAIKLHDGRRAYVDGDTYRDAEGHELKGADRAEAEVEHVTRPDATTWQEHEHAIHLRTQLEKIRVETENLQGNPDDPRIAAKLAAAESQFAKANQGGVRQSATLPDYGQGDYTNDLSGLINSYRADGALAPSAPVQGRFSPQKNATPSF